MGTNGQVVIKKLETGIPGFDLITNEGLPEDRATLIPVSAGNAKTVFAVQFLAEGIIKAEEGGIFVTFEESPGEIRKNMVRFGFDIPRWEVKGKWAFVDASPQPGGETVVSGGYDFGALLARIEYAVERVGAKRVSMDSLGAIFTQFTGSTVVRGELFRVASALKKMGVTAVITAERTQEYNDIAPYGVEEFIADDVIVLGNAVEDKRLRRTIEILKFRATSNEQR
ncbi:MAG: ATPase domain-containing protein [Candidatus Binatia bacterium]